MSEESVAEVFAFRCAVCGAEAGRLVAFPEEGRISIEGIICQYNARPDASHMAEMLEHIRNYDAEALLKIDSDWTQSYCPTCKKTYCRKHWNTGVVYDEGFYDYTEGTCPEGHERMLDD